MKHVKIYEQFTEEEIGQLTSPKQTSGEFETESTDFKPTLEDEEGEYVVNFINVDGEETTITIGHAIDPKYTGNAMVSELEMVMDSSSDGREYDIIGYYTKSEDFRGAYNLEKVILMGR